MKFEDQYKKMLEFMHLNNVGVNSKHNLSEWVKKVYEKGGKCPCNPKIRPECPCSQAMEEIKSKGVCDCKLFGNNNACYGCNKSCKMLFVYYDQIGREIE